MASTLSIGVKIQSITLTALLGLTILVGISTFSIYASVTSARSDSEMQLVESASGVVQYFYREEQAGRMTRSAAQSVAAAAVRAMRYDGDQYFFITDLQARMIMHTIMPALESTDAGTIADPNGYHPFAEMADLVRRQGEGSVSYLWPKPGTHLPVAKITFVKGFQPWGWVIGTGNYVDETFARVRMRIATMIAGIMVVLLATGAVAIVVGRHVSRPLVALATTMGELAAGNYNQGALPSTRKDELGRMIQSMTVFRKAMADRMELEAQASAAFDGAEARRKAQMRALADDLQGTVSQIADEVSVAADDLRSTSERLSRNALNSASRSNTVAASAEEAAAAVVALSAAAQQLEASVNHIAEQARDSEEMATSATREARMTAALVGELSQSATQIIDVVAAISSIAQRTNLLALNATIEAARAGEAGRGFAVVASEVKQLSSQSAQSAGDIQVQIEKVQQSMGRAGDAIQSIGGRIMDLSTAATKIAGAVDQQEQAAVEIARGASQAAAGTSAVTRNIIQVARDAEETGTASDRVLQSADRLSQHSARLSAAMNEFLSGLRAA